MDGKDAATIVAAIVTGTFSGYLGAYMNFVIAKKTRKHELKVRDVLNQHEKELVVLERNKELELKKYETVKEQNQQIAKLTGSIKTSVYRIGFYSLEYVHSTIHYWRFYQGQLIYRNLQEIDKGLQSKMAVGGKDYVEAEERIKQRGAAIERGHDEVKEVFEKGNHNVHALNKEIDDLLYSVTQLGYISGKDLMKWEEWITDYRKQNFNFIDFDAIQKEILAEEEDTDRLNSLSREVILPRVDKQIMEYADTNVSKIIEELKQTDFKIQYLPEDQK
jgi:hypothetical protein